MIIVDLAALWDEAGGRDSGVLDEVEELEELPDVPSVWIFRVV
jgi:hypothetical protein